MIFAVINRDAPGSGPLREAHLAEHLAHVEATMERYRIAGPLKGPDGATNGSLVILEATDEAQARAFVEADPYYCAGVWAQIEIVPFLPVAGEWVGGAAWKN